MSLYLVLVRSNKKRLVTLTLKRSLKIGSGQECDIVINHPHLHKHPQVLGPGSTTRETSVEDKAKAPFFFPVHTYSTDGLNVRMIHLKVFINVLLIACLGIASLTVNLTDHSAFSISQDWTPIILPAEGVYGFCRQDRNHGEGVRFSFEAKKSQPYKLVFFTGSKGDGTSITLSLNGTVISKPLNLTAGWGKETSVPLPSANIINGKNIVEVRATSTNIDPLNWGISEIRALPVGQPNNHLKNVSVHDHRSILNALAKQEINGQELAHYYKTVSSWEISTPSESSSVDRDSIMEEIERRMRNKLHQVAFDIRSKNILGDKSAVQQLLDDTSSWIPGDWFEGWEIYNELCH
jgi:hypothetical protein